LAPWKRDHKGTAMTQQIPQWYQDQWQRKAIIRYQNKGNTLKGLTTPPIRMEGQNFHFPRMGVVEAQIHPRGDDAAVVNGAADLVHMTTTRWSVGWPIEDFDADRIPVNEHDVALESCTNAIGRRSDRIIYDAVMAVALPAPQIIVLAAGLDPYSMSKALQVLVTNDVPSDDDNIFCPLPGLAYRQIEMYKEFANADWAGPDLPLIKKRKGRTWDIGNFFELANPLVKQYTNTTGAAVNGTPANTLRFRIWHRDAIGYGAHREIEVEWERQALKKRWVGVHTMDGGATCLQTEGIVEIQIPANSTVAQQIITTHAV
jgi:Phage capsid protein